MYGNRSERTVCAQCIYFQIVDRTTGTCHRYPPGFAGDNSPREDHRWRFPTVNNLSWCGEFQPVETQPK